MATYFDWEQDEAIRARWRRRLVLPVLRNGGSHNIPMGKPGIRRRLTCLTKLAAISDEVEPYRIGAPSLRRGVEMQRARHCMAPR